LTRVNKEKSNTAAVSSPIRVRIRLWNEQIDNYLTTWNNAYTDEPRMSTCAFVSDCLFITNQMEFVVYFESEFYKQV